MSVRILIIFLLSLSLFSCSSYEKGTRAESDKNSTGESRQASEGQPAPAAPTTFKANLTLIGAIVTAIDILDSMNYQAHIHLHTAVPASGYESIAEPDQHITVVPSYFVDEARRIDLTNARNKRLWDVRALKSGDFLFGKIALHGDGVWYLEDTELN